MAFEVTKICRTCLGLDGVLLSIYDSKGSNGSGCIADMLRDIIRAEAKKSDGMPEKVCLMCISEINRCYSFKMKCYNSDRTLRQLLNIPEEPTILAMQKLNQGKPSKSSSSDSNSFHKDCVEENKKQIKRKLAEINQEEDVKRDCPSSVIERTILQSDQIEGEGSSSFAVQSEDNEVIENKNEEILDYEQNSGDYSIIFTKFVHETQDEEAQMIDEREGFQKQSQVPLMLECSSKESKLESKCTMCPMSFVHIRNLKKHIIRVHDTSEPTSTNISKEGNVVPFYHEELKFSREKTESRDVEYDLQLIEEIEENNVKQDPQPVCQNIETHVKELRCPRCKALFAMNSSLNIHIKMNKCTIPQFSCGDCKKVFISQKSLKEHMKTHKFFCETCGENLDSKIELVQHREEHQGANPKHQCPNCRKVFTMRSTLNDHMRIHTGEKPFVCDLCGKAFSQNANLKQHVMRHNKTKPFKCEQCHRSFVSKGELYAHLRSHNGDQPFRCDSCPSAFTTSSSLVKHKRIHTGERPYSCDFCPMRFTALNTLKNHRRTHTGEKPYKCKFCPRAFAQKSDCSIHMRTHTGERRYSCNICSMKFQQSGTLRTHMKTHKDRVLHSQQEFEEHTEQSSHELEIIEIEDGQLMLGELEDRRQLETHGTSADSEEGVDMSQDELLHFQIDDCASVNSVFSGE